MLKRLFLIFASFMLSSLSFAQGKEITTIRMGLKVEVSLPTELLGNATINRFFNPDSLFIKRNDGSYISITPINRELLYLSSSFNLGDYPKHIMSLAEEESLAEINSDDLATLTQARTAWSTNKKTHNEVSVHEQISGTLYAKCEKTLCYNFFTEHAQNDELAVIEVYGIDNKSIIDAIGGGSKK